MPSAQVGLLLAALSAVFNGTFGVLAKIRKARRVPPLIINYWMAEGVGLSGLLLFAFPPRIITPWGLLSGALFVASAAHAVTAINLVGLSVATGVWCGTAVLVSFAYGVLVAGDHVANMGQAVLALCIILGGIAGIALAGWMGAGNKLEETDSGLESEDFEEGLLGADDEGEPSGATAATASLGAHLPPATKAVLGLAAAVMAGAIGGLILAPMLKAPPEARGLQFVPSQALGALLVAPLITTVTNWWRALPFTEATSSRAAGPGMAAGAIWNAGNCCCIAAVTNPHVGLAVAMPIMQCGLFVAGVWGIFLFGEISGRRALALYWLSGAVLVGGAALLAAAKGG